LNEMGELVFIGLGLYDNKGISIRGLDEVRNAEIVFIELYTSLMPGFSLQRFEKTVGKRVSQLPRAELEDNNGRAIFEAAKKHRTVLLVPGDPMIATTHVSLRIEAEKLGITTRIVNGASALSAVIGMSGLHNYKFGKSVTIPFPDETPSETPYRVISQNKRSGLHTLCLLDINASEERFLSIIDALKELLSIEEKRKKGIVTPNTLVVGIARAGGDDSIVKAGPAKEILYSDFGGPPQSLIFPGRLHFMEAEALTVLAGAPSDVGKVRK